MPLINTIFPQGPSVVHNPAAATQATIGVAAAGVGYKNVCIGITASIATAGTLQTPIHVYLRDGATGIGTIKWSCILAAPVNGLAAVALTGLSFAGSDNTGMTLEFEAAGVAASVESVTLQTIPSRS